MAGLSNGCIDCCSRTSHRYNSAFGSPVARAQGIGYVQELVARLTHTPIETHNSTTNSTLDDNPVTFPLGQSLYVDATHEVVILNSEFPVDGNIYTSLTPFFSSNRIKSVVPG